MLANPSPKATSACMNVLAGVVHTHIRARALSAYLQAQLLFSTGTCPKDATAKRSVGHVGRRLRPCSISICMLPHLSRCEGGDSRRPRTRFHLLSLFAPFSPSLTIPSQTLELEKPLCNTSRTHAGRLDFHDATTSDRLADLPDGTDILVQEYVGSRRHEESGRLSRTFQTTCQKQLRYRSLKNSQPSEEQSFIRITKDMTKFGCESYAWSTLQPSTPSVLEDQQCSNRNLVCSLCWKRPH
jgi:hypothetical protein